VTTDTGLVHRVQGVFVYVSWQNFAGTHSACPQMDDQTELPCRGGLVT